MDEGGGAASTEAKKRQREQRLNEKEMKEGVA